jgi:anti-sigma regulatory factor (Ser/Thr protein kinase)
MFGYSPPRPRDTAALHARDARPGPPVLSPVPSLELCSPAGWDDPAENRHLGEIDLAATPAAVRPARSYVRELVGDHFAASPAALGDLQLLTSEAVTNSILHARPRLDGTIMLAALCAGGRVRVEVTDGGPVRTAPPMPAGPLAVSGRGLHLISVIADGHGTRRNDDGTTTFWFEVAVGDGRSTQ